MKFHVRIYGGPRGVATIVLDVDKNDTVFNVKTQIQEKEGIPPERQRLLKNGNFLSNGDTIVNYLAPGLDSPSCICIVKFTVKIASLSGDLLEIEMQAHESSYHIKQRILDMRGIPPDQQRLTFEGKLLENSRELCEYDGLGDQSIISLAVVCTCNSNKICKLCWKSILGPWKP